MPVEIKTYICAVQSTVQSSRSQFSLTAIKSTVVKQNRRLCFQNYYFTFIVFVCEWVGSDFNLPGTRKIFYYSKNDCCNFSWIQASRVYCFRATQVGKKRLLTLFRNSSCKEGSEEPNCIPDRKTIRKLLCERRVWNSEVGNALKQFTKTLQPTKKNLNTPKQRMEDVLDTDWIRNLFLTGDAVRVHFECPLREHTGQTSRGHPGRRGRFMTVLMGTDVWIDLILQYFCSSSVLTWSSNELS